MFSSYRGVKPLSELAKHFEANPLNGDPIVVEAMLKPMDDNPDLIHFNKVISDSIGQSLKN